MKLLFTIVVIGILLFSSADFGNAYDIEYSRPYYPKEGDMWYEGSKVYTIWYGNTQEIYYIDGAGWVLLVKSDL